ncbi:MAG: chemotaxis protein CheW [Acaryochloridaceae cyanobacterium SU_2_1]|nr:chemotaxis protein CheW [Acaryochloridaceae cyanobacterium SU_2_1]
MAISNSVRSRRIANRQTEAKQQLITFKIRGERFAIPVTAVRKVIPIAEIYGDPQQTGISLTHYQGQEILVVDVGHRIFAEALSTETALGEALLELSTATLSPDLKQQECLVLIQDPEGGVVGVPIDSQPAILWASQSQINPLPSSYLNRGNINAVTSMVVDESGAASYFLLDPEQISMA